MNPFTRAQLLKLAQSEGYTGDADLAKVKAFLTENNIVPKYKGKAVDIDAAWATAKSVDFADEADEATDEPAETPEVPATKAAAPGGGRPGIGAPRTALNLEGKEAPTRFQNPEAFRKMMDRKSYDRKAATGGTVFSCSDAAEVFAAGYRVLVAKACNLTYDHQSVDLDIVAKAGSTVVNANSGALVDPEFSSAIMWLTEQYGVARKLFAVQPMKSDTWTGKRKTGIFSMSHVNQNGAFTATNNTYDNITLTAVKVGALIQDSTELLEDAAGSGVSIADDYAKSFAEAQAYTEDSDAILGDGSATYGGIMGLTSALPSGAYISATGSGWSSMLLSDFTLAIGSVQNVNPSRLSWLCSRQFYYQVMVKLSAIGSSSGYLGGGNTMENIAKGPGPNAQFLGYPVYFSQVMPTATAGSEDRAVYFGDFMGCATLGDRRQLAIKSSEHYALNSDQITVLGTSRIAINVHGDGRASTYGPVVCLTST